MEYGVRMEYVMILSTIILALLRDGCVVISEIRDRSLGSSLGHYSSLGTTTIDSVICKAGRLIESAERRGCHLSLQARICQTIAVEARKLE